MSTTLPAEPVSPLPGALVLSSVLTLLAAARLHAKTEKSIANAVLGLLHSSRLSVTAIGTAWAQVMGRGAKHGVKQVDRLVSNDNFDLHSCFRAHVRAVVGSRRSIITALDWTEFAPDDQATICLYLITNHGRATPLVWKTVELSAMRGRRNSFEDEVLHLFKASLPREGAPKVVVLADRGFSDVALYAELEEELGFDFVIRFRRNVLVQYGERRLRSDQWLAEAGGYSVQLRGAALTSRFRRVVNFVALHDSEMRDPWFLASSLPGSVKAIAKLYGRRFTIEETFRDQKDMRFGWALHDIQVTQPLRRDRLLFLAALAQVLLTLLGAAGEQLGLDAGLRVNTTKRRTHSLPRQGREYIRGVVNQVAHQLREQFIILFNSLPESADRYAII